MIEKKTRVPNRPTRYELIDKDGNPIIVPKLDGTGKEHLTFDSPLAAAEFAKIRWPDQEQDEDRTGKGWDIQVVGADR